MDKKEIRSIARRVARRLKVEDGDMVVLKKGEVLTEDMRLFNALRRQFGVIAKERVVLAVVDDFDDIKVFNEIEMQSYGWCRCDEEE